MPPSKLRVAVFDGIRSRTQEFNADVFPQSSNEWTPEQIAIFNFLNGESGGFSRINDSDRPEIERTLRKVAGIEGMTSRFNLTSRVTVPPYVTVVLRSSIDPYPALFPIIHARISGYWAENGTGSTRDISVNGSQLRPATDDDVATIERKFPEDKLTNLVGAIKFPDEAKLRKALVKEIIERTKAFHDADFQETIPPGITDKGLAILKLHAFNTVQLQAISLILDDPAMLGEYRPAPINTSYAPYVCVVWSRNSSAMSYCLDKPHVQAGMSTGDVFFTIPEDESGEGVLYGNHANADTDTVRVATDDEVKDYVKKIPADRLHLYVSALSKETITALL